MMDEVTFRRESIRAQARATVEPQHAAYWRGYREGLRRARLGAAAGPEAGHRQWLQLAWSRDPEAAARGAGYRDALAIASGVAAGRGRGRANVV
jgi:hypothetical protein